jgi:hypothetical protein
MEQQDNHSSHAQQTALSREELEQHLRARAWKDDAFRQEFLTNPQAVLERDYAQYFPEGQIPSGLSIKVIEEDEQAICFVLPSKLSDDQLPELENISDEEILASVAGGGGTQTGEICVVTIVLSCSGTCKINGCKSGRTLEGNIGKLKR